ncbi:hypothetical protein RZS08_39895, partial [Arthrospira platensis SPKY1]|nr:hypothetical protein [Arthrospira platensis SPKY1]
VFTNSFPIFNKDQIFPFENAQYFILIAKQFNINLNINTTLDDFISQLENLRNDNLNPQLENRIIELKLIKDRNGLLHTAPFQLDMKNNAIQHISTICRDEDIMKSVGVIKGGEIDIYTQIAEKVYRVYKSHAGSD